MSSAPAIALFSSLALLVACSAGTIGDGAATLGDSEGGSDGTSTGMALTTTPVSTGTMTATSTSASTSTSVSTSADASTASTTESVETTSSGTSGTDSGTGSTSTGGELPVLASCGDLLSFEPSLEDGVYLIDPDGPGAISGLEVYCDMTRDGGGWTLVMVGGDDGTSTWTYADRALMTTNETSVGDVQSRNLDFKSIAFHRIPFSGLLFGHEPSGIWAAYDVASNGVDFGTFMAGLPSPHCDDALPGNGIPMTAGTLTVLGSLCDTDLYFHLGDWDGGAVTLCEDSARTFNNTTFGPVWNSAANGGCPFDDPNNASLGPSIQCVDCLPGEDMLERPAVGFGAPAALNTGMPGAGENHMQVFVR